MLLLQFALLNVLCLEYCITNNIITLTNKSHITTKIHFPSLIQSKRLILQQADIKVKFRRSAKATNFRTWQGAQGTAKAIDGRLNSAGRSVQSFRDRRYIIDLKGNPPNAEFSDENFKAKPRQNITVIAKLSSEKRQQKAIEIPAGYPRVALPIEKLFANVGVSFQKYLSPDMFHDKPGGNANSLSIKLLTSDGKELFASSWIKFDQSNLKLYGFPLKGNQNEHLFILKATDRKGRSAVQKISIVVYALEPNYNHYVHMCTTMTLSDYGGSVERRLRLAKVIANYIFPRRRPEDVWIWKFEDGCIYFTFRHLPWHGQCDYNALQTIEDKIFDNGDVNTALRQALKGVTHVVSLNLTLLDECRKSNTTGIDDGLGWLRNVAPIFILIAVVAVPTLISCIVCREVRRRQAAMRQLQDRRMKEDREQMLLQAAEYKHECGFDSESEDGEGCTNRPFRQQEEEGKKFFGFSRIADIILPEVVIDTVKQGTEIFNTFLPQETRDSAAVDTKVGANRLFPTGTEANSSNRFLGESQEEKDMCIERAETSLTSKVKGVLNFIRSPLEIASMGDTIDSKEEDNLGQMQLPESRKVPKIPAEALLPSISSIFGLDTSDRAHGPLRDIRKSMSSKIRQQFQLVMKAASINTSKESDAQGDDDIGVREALDVNERFNVPRVQYRKGSQMLGRTSSAYINFSRSVPMLPSKFKIPDQRKILDSKARWNSNEEHVRRGSKSDSNASEDGLLNRILYQSKNLISSTRNWRLSQQDSKEDIQLKEITKIEHEDDAECNFRRNGCIETDLIIGESINECKQSEGNAGTAPNLSMSFDAMCSQIRMRDCICDEQLNPFRYYKNTAMDYYAQNTPHDLAPELTRESHFMQSAVTNHKLLENTDLCFVNIGEAQLEKELSLIEAADGNWRESECLSGRRKSNEKQTHACSPTERFEISNLGREYNLYCGDQLDEGVLRGLKHYDPESGRWYPATNDTPLKSITPARKMFSLLGSFKRNEERSLSKKSSMHTDDGMNKGGLHWYGITDEAPEKRREPERNRRKTGMDIGSHIIFDQTSSNIYEQDTEFDSSYEMSHMQWKGRRQESIGIWTENIYDNDEMYDDTENSDVCQSSDEETDLQYLIDRMHSQRSPHYRYCPDEQHGEEYFSNETISSERYRAEYIPYSEVLNTIPEGSCLEEGLKDDLGPLQMYFKCEGDQNDRTQHQNEEHFEESRWSHLGGPAPDDEVLAAGDEAGDFEKGSSKDNSEYFDFETLQDKSSGFIEGRRRSSTDSQLQLSTILLETLDSPTRSEPGYTTKNKESPNTLKERRKSFLERQRRVEIPEKTASSKDQVAAPKIHVNPVFVIEERMSKEELEEREHVEDRFDFAAVSKLESAYDQPSKAAVRMRKLTYSGPFTTANIEAEKTRKQDADIIEHQMKGYLERRRQSLQHISGASQFAKSSFSETEPIAIQNRAKREDPQRRTGMRRFSTPSMESWTSTPEKYYYDATGDNSISEEDVNCAGLRKDKEKKAFTSGRGRAKEYTQRLLQGVSPKIRRHSTSILGQRCNPGQSGGSVSNTGTFLGKIGEGKFVQTIQTKLGKKESKAEEPKSPISKEKEKYMEEEKQLKGSPLTAIRNTLFLFSGGK